VPDLAQRGGGIAADDLVVVLERPLEVVGEGGLGDDAEDVGAVLAARGGPSARSRATGASLSRVAPRCLSLEMARSTSGREPFITAEENSVGSTSRPERGGRERPAANADEARAAQRTTERTAAEARLEAIVRMGSI
jgi:hypothetical protein